MNKNIKIYICIIFLGSILIILNNLPKKNIIYGGEEETRQVLKNLIAVVEAAGGDNSNVIRTTIYLTDLNDFAKVNHIYAETFNNKVCPARACVEVSNLPKGGKIEIDCIAWLGKIK